jgi:hypothetical protein
VSKIPLIAPTFEVGEQSHQFSGPAEWASETTQGLKELVPEFCDQVYPTVNHLGAAFDSFTPQLQLPVSTAVAGLRTAIEANVGKAIGDIMPDELGIDFNKVASMVGNIAGAAIASGVNSKEFIQSLTKAVVGMLDGIPLLGAIIQGVMGFIWADLDEWDQKAAATCKEFSDSFMADWKTYCGSLAKSAIPIPTMGGTAMGIKGADFQGRVTPADTFRGLAYVFRKGSQKIPASPASLYLLLCGGEAQGFGLSRREYNDLKKQNTGTGSGIPVGTQRRMWKLIRALMSSAQPPLSAFKRTSDQGATIMPILQELVRTSWVAGHWNQNWLQVLNHTIGQRHRMSASTHFNCGGSSAIKRVNIHGEADCSGHYRVPATCACWGPTVEYQERAGSYGAFFDIVPAFMNSLVQWKLQLGENFYNQEKGAWDVASPKSRFRLALVRKVSMVVFSPKQGKQLVKDIKSAADASKGIDPAEAARIKKAKELEARNRKAAIGTTAVVLGAGSFVLARKAAKKARSTAARR